MKLWLDDERLPPSTVTCFSGIVSEWTWVKKAKDAITWLKTGLVTDVSLDHDLGHPQNGTGYEVAEFIEGAAHAGELPPLRVSVHTQNPVGREKMVAAMRSAYRAWGKTP